MTRASHVDHFPVCAPQKMPGRQTGLAVWQKKPRRRHFLENPGRTPFFPESAVLPFQQVFAVQRTKPACDLSSQDSVRIPLRRTTFQLLEPTFLPFFELRGPLFCQYGPIFGPYWQKSGSVSSKSGPELVRSWIPGNLRIDPFFPYKVL